MRKHWPNIEAEENSNAAQIDLDGSVLIEAAEHDAEGKQTRPARVEIVAYNGGELPVKGFDAPVIVDLDGIEGMDRRSIPLLRDHDRSRIVGQVNPKRVGNTIEASGKLVGRSDDRKEIEELAADGFEWQSSVGVRPKEMQRVKAGATVEVNGREFTGPAYVARKSRLAELTVCTIGADADGTHVAIAAEDGDGDDRYKYTGGGSSNSNLDGIKAERERRANIEATAIKLIDAGHDLDTIEAMMQTAIDEKHTVERFELDVLRKASRPAGRIGPGRSRNELEGEVLAEAVEASILKSAGWSAGVLEDNYNERSLNAMDKHSTLKHGLSLQDVLLFAAEQNGQRPSRRDVNAMLQGAFPMVQASGLSTFDLSGILSNVANKQLRVAFLSVTDLMAPGGMAMQAYSTIGAVGSVTDFKQRTAYSLTGDMTYEELAPGGELKSATVGEETYTNQAKTYGKMFGVDRTDIINDDLGAFTQAPRRLGRGAALKLSDVFWTAFMDNSAFYTAGRNNYADGAATALSIDSLSTAEALFINQTDPDSKPLNILPQMLLAPPALFAQATTLMSSQQIVYGGTSKQPINNPHAGKYQPMTSPYLSNASYTGNSALAWYLLADPETMPVIETVFLNGQQQPTVDQTEADFKQLGIQMRGYHDFGVAAVEYRGGVKMKGEA